MRLLSAADVRAAITMPEAIEAMRTAFAQLASGAARVPPRLALETPHGVTLSMPAYTPGMLTVKVVCVNPGNREAGLAAIQGAVLACHPVTGVPLALIDGPSLTQWRTGAATGLATSLLARPEAASLVIFGAGAQSAQQIAGVRAVRELRSVITLRRGDDCTAALAEADIVVTATNSAAPVCSYGQLRPGTHLNAIGAYRTDMRELDEATMAHAKVVVDQRESAVAEAGELQGGVAIHAELGELVLGRRPARETSEELTVFKSVGHGVQDAAIAAAILHGADRLGLGQIFDFG